MARTLAIQVRIRQVNRHSPRGRFGWLCVTHNRDCLCDTHPRRLCARRVDFSAFAPRAIRPRRAGACAYVPEPPRDPAASIQHVVDAGCPEGGDGNAGSRRSSQRDVRAALSVAGDAARLAAGGRGRRRRRRARRVDAGPRRRLEQSFASSPRRPRRTGRQPAHPGGAPTAPVAHRCRRGPVARGVEAALHRRPATPAATQRILGSSRSEPPRNAAGSRPGRGSRLGRSLTRKFRPQGVTRVPGNSPARPAAHGARARRAPPGSGLVEPAPPRTVANPDRRRGKPLDLAKRPLDPLRRQVGQRTRQVIEEPPRISPPGARSISQLILSSMTSPMYSNKRSCARKLRSCQEGGSTRGRGSGPPEAGPRHRKAGRPPAGAPAIRRAPATRRAPACPAAGRPRSPRTVNPRPRRRATTPPPVRRPTSPRLRYAGPRQREFEHGPSGKARTEPHQPGKDAHMSVRLELGWYDRPPGGNSHSALPPTGTPPFADGRPTPGHSILSATSRRC